METITYTYRGGIEVGTGSGYRWADGYSETTPDGSVTYPWMTRLQCQKDARSRGCRAAFVETKPLNTHENENHVS